MRNYQKLWVIVGVLLLCVAGYWGWHFFSMGYHHHRMMVDYRAAQRLQPYDAKRQPLMTAYEKHRAALMKLGYYAKHQFYFNHISASSEKFQQLLRLLPERFPYEIGKIEPHGYIYGEPPFMVVWVHPGDVKRVERLVVEQDSP